MKKMKSRRRKNTVSNIINVIILTVCMGLCMAGCMREFYPSAEANDDYVYEEEYDYATYLATEVLAKEVEIAEAAIEEESEEVIEVLPVEEATEEVVIEETVEEVVDNTYLYSDNELYWLAKIIMAEAEGETYECKLYVGQVILNRVNDYRFPDTIYGVIYEKVNGAAQFTPTIDGRLDSVEPNQECYDAARYLLTSAPITDALWFESCTGESWHSQNLTLVAAVDSMKFYTE